MASVDDERFMDEVYVKGCSLAHRDYAFTHQELARYLTLIYRSHGKDRVVDPSDPYLDECDRCFNHTWPRDFKVFTRPLMVDGV